MSKLGDELLARTDFNRNQEAEPRDKMGLHERRAAAAEAARPVDRSDVVRLQQELHRLRADLAIAKQTADKAVQDLVWFSGGRTFKDLADAAIRETVPNEFLSLQQLAVGENVADNFVRADPHGCYLSAGGAATVYNSLYEIYDLDAEARTFKIRGESNAASIAGAFKTVTTLNQSAISATSWVYLVIERVSGTATITCTTTMATPDDDTEIFPLWYVPVADGAITSSGIIDYRYTKHWVAGA